MLNWLWNKLRGHTDSEPDQPPKPMQLRYIPAERPPKPVQPKRIPAEPPVIHVTDAAAARRLFRQYDGDSYALEKACDAQMLQDFRQFSDAKTEKLWAAELCREKLEAAAAGTAPYDKMLVEVNRLMDYYLRDPMTELYTKAWFAVLDAEPASLRVGCILVYLELFTKRFSPEQAAQILPLLDRTEAYLKQYAPEALAQGRHTSHEGHFREICGEIRRIVRESTPEESAFSFVKTPPGVLDIIRDSLMEEWQNMDTVKELTACLNCAYGVQGDAAGDRLFLTGSSNAADYPSLQNWDILEFVAVLLDERKAVQFRCRRTDDGSLAIESQYLKKQPLTAKHQTALTQAVRAYRNIKAKRAFLAAWDGWVNAAETCQEAYLAQFPKVMRDVYARIPDCAIADTLTLMVDYAEESIGEYGTNSIQFAEPASAAEIAQWEQTNGVCLPQAYKQFLEFANGVSLPFAIELFGLEQLDLHRNALVNEGRDAYHQIGSFIGDGTGILFCESDGQFYEWQDGEISEMGDFDDMVCYICKI